MSDRMTGGGSGRSGPTTILLLAVAVLLCFASFWAVRPALERQPFFCRLLLKCDAPPTPPQPVPELHSVEPSSIILAGQTVTGSFRLVKDSQGLAATKHYGGACIVFRPEAAQSCGIDADCTTPMATTFESGVSECAEAKCWQKLDEAHCRKFKAPEELTIDKFETTAVPDITVIKTYLKPNKKNDPLIAAVLSCYNAAFTLPTTPPCTRDPSPDKKRRVSTTTVTVN